MEILSVLAALKSGRVIDHLNEQFTKLSNSVRHLRGKGKLTLTLNLEPRIDRHTGEVVEQIIGYDLKIVEPQQNHGESTFFVHPETGELVQDDPRQMSLEREWSTAKEENRK